MTNKMIGWGIIATLGTTVFVGILGLPNPNYTLLGFFIFFFGVWGGIRLIKS